jgi:hypothetical protein
MAPDSAGAAPEGAGATPDSAAAFTVELDGYAMHLRPSEIRAVAAGLGGDPLTLLAALRQLPTIDRPPTWELAVRHYGRRHVVAQAAGEIGMDVIHARDLLARLTTALDSSPIADS